MTKKVAHRLRIPFSLTPLPLRPLVSGTTLLIIFIPGLEKYAKRGDGPSGYFLPPPDEAFMHENKQPALTTNQDSIPEPSAELHLSEWLQNSIKKALQVGKI